MPDSSEEKTEKATPKKRSDQRKEGNIFQSKEVIIAFSLIVTFVAFRLLFPLVKSSLTDAIKSYFSLAGTQETLEISDTTQLFISGCIVFGKSGFADAFDCRCRRSDSGDCSDEGTGFFQGH